MQKSMDPLGGVELVKLHGTQGQNRIGFEEVGCRVIGDCNGPDCHAANPLFLFSKFLSVFPRYLTPICTGTMSHFKVTFLRKESEREGSLSGSCALCPVHLNALVYLVGAPNVEGLFTLIEDVDATVGGASSAWGRFQADRT